MTHSTKILIPDIDKYNGFDVISSKQQEVVISLTNQIDTELSKRIIALGVDINDADFIKNNFEFIEREGDDFKHLLYKPESRFIFSIQKDPTIQFNYNGSDIVDNVVTCTCEYKYY